MKRAIALACALGLGALVTYGMGELSRPSAYQQDSASIVAAYEAERALATDQGLVILGEDVTEAGALTQQYALEAGECVALVAAIEGTVPLQASLAVGTLSTTRDGDLVHLAACASEPTTATWSWSWGGVAPFEQSQRTHYAVLRGQLRRPRTYARLAYDDRTRALFDARAVHARLAALVPDDARIGEASAADPEHAALFPPTRASFAALRGLSGRRDLAPAVLPEQASADPFVTPTDESTGPRVLAPTAPMRAIAVVDAGALGANCVTVSLARLDDPLTATPITRISIPDLGLATLEGSDPAIAIDVICPASGLYVYAVQPPAGGAYEVSVARREAVTAMPPLPSGFGAATTGRPPRDGFTFLHTPFVDGMHARCAATDARACFALAVLARDRIEGAGTVHEALAPLCTATGGEACDVLAGILADDEPERARSLERRACMTGVPDACMRHGARALEDARDLAGAYRTFRYGCGAGCAACCTAAAAMLEWQLAPAGADEAPPEPG